MEWCAEDLVFVLNQLEQLESGAVHSPFQERLDLDRIGVFGHSFGGRVAARACQLDDRLKAGILCDGFGRKMAVDKKPNGSTVEQPMMVLYARRVPLHGWARTQALLQTPGSDLEAELRRAERILRECDRRQLRGHTQHAWNNPRKFQRHPAFGRRSNRSNPPKP